MKISTDAGVVSEGFVSCMVESLLKEEGGFDALGERDCARAEFRFGVEEDSLVDEVLGQEGSVEQGTAFEEETEDLAFGEDL